MDTQLKKSRYNILFKIIAWALCIAGMCAVAWGGANLAKIGWDGGGDGYLNSNEYRSAMEPSSSYVYGAFYLDNTSLQRDIVDRLAELETEREVKLAALYDTTGDETEIDPQNTQLIDAINKLYDARIEEAKDSIRQTYELLRSEQRAALADQKDMLYAVTENGAVVQTNIDERDAVGFIKSMQTCMQKTYYVTAEDSSSVMDAESALVQADTAAAPADWELDASAEGSAASFDMGTVAAIESAAMSEKPAETEIIVYTAMPQAVFEQSQSEYISNAAHAQTYLLWLIGGLAAFAAGFIWLLLTAGKTPLGTEVLVGPGDAIPLDIGCIIMVLIEVLCISAVADSYISNTYDLLSITLLSLLVSLGVVAFNLWFISLAKRIRRNDAEKYTVCYMLFGGIAGLYRKSAIQAKTFWPVFIGIICCMICAGIFAGGVYGGSGAVMLTGSILLVLIGVFALRFLLKKMMAVQKISEGLQKIKEGDLEYVIAPDGGMELEGIADDINHIADGFKSAVIKEVRAERMKTELITNISHDLKTPLTSILAYIDLLKKEDLQGENAVKYLDVLDMKANRLKVLTEDLFEAAKAASGDIVVNMTQIELVQFMQQVQGELSDKIEKSGLVFINDIPDDKMYVCADGKLLWRVIGNVLDNVLKYAMEGSRVYIDIKKTMKAVSITVKNISRDPLNIEEDELMERSVRGDVSRHTEGSGLGLSIAKNLMLIMGCGFEIGIDGDLFKVVMTLKEG